MSHSRTSPGPVSGSVPTAESFVDTHVDELKAQAKAGGDEPATQASNPTPLDHCIPHVDHCLPDGRGRNTVAHQPLHKHKHSNPTHVDKKPKNSSN